MAVPVQVTYRAVDPSTALDAYVIKRAEKLETFFTPILRCRVMIEAPHRHHQKGSRYHVRIDLSVPDEEVVVRRNPDNLAHQDVHACIDAAFDDAQRRLEDYARRRRHEVKHHAPPPVGRVTKLFPDEGYGFLESPEGVELYFHRNSVLHRAFDRLKIGAKVRYVEELGEKGPQASTVVLVERS